jgi:hypothetical protein
MLGMPFRRVAFHASQSDQAKKGLRVKPLFDRELTNGLVKGLIFG